MILTTRPYTDFLTFVLPLVPNCYEEQATSAIRNTCIDFCRDSLFLQQDLDAISTNAGQSTYDIDTPTDYILGQVLGIYYLNRKLERKSQTELEKLYTRNWQYLQGNPQVYTQLNPDQITLVYTPADSVSAAITGRFSYIPARTSTSIDNTVFERFLDVIVDGAASRLMATPNQPYSDANASIAYQRIFRDGCQRALRYTRDGMNNAPMRARYNRIW
jgi:hypothetical protein